MIRALQSRSFIDFFRTLLYDGTMIRERHIHTNDTDICFAVDRRLNSFCIGAYFLAGSMYETERDNGISHLYEHMVFRNLKRLYGGRLYHLLSENGLYLDASTYKELIQFTVSGVAEGIDLAIDIIKKLFQPLDIAEEEYDAEKKRIYCEINEDDEKHTLDWLHGRRCWGSAFPAAGNLGRRSNLKRISLTRLDRFRESVISKDNLFLCVTGNVDAEHEAKIEEAAAKIPVNPVSICRRNEVPVAADFVFGRGDIAVMDSDWSKIDLSFGFDSKRTPMPIRELLYSALYERDECALCQELSENDPVSYDYSGTLEQYNDRGCFTLAYETFEGLLAKSFEAVVRAINRIKQGDFDLELNKKKLADAFKLTLDDPCSLNWDLAYYGRILESPKPDWSRPALGRYEAVSMEDVTSAAREIFTRDNLVVTLRGDRRRIDKAELEEVLSGLG